jgi:hypothetical protein
MNKRGLIKYIFILITAIISFYFMFTSDINVTIIPVLFIFIFALTIFMFVYRNNIKKFKFIYDVSLMLLMVFTVACFALSLYDIIKCYLNSSCGIEVESIGTTLYILLLFIMILFGIKDIYTKTNKTNDILTIVISSLIILIHIRYYLEPNFVHKLTKGNEFILYKYQYITQNYIYFTIMYIISIIHYGLNREK